MEKKKTQSLTAYLFSTAVFGTVGIFRRFILLPSGYIALARGIIGALFIVCFILLKGKKFSLADIKKNLARLLITGALIGINWILLFESYNYTTVAVATLCYYMAPIIIIVMSPLVFFEKITVKNALCVLVAALGMLFVSGVFGGQPGKNDIIGIILGLSSAAVYAAVIMMNKKLSDISAYDKTAVQLFAAAAVILPYSLVFEEVNVSEIDTRSVVLLLILGVIHTGFTYTLYFGSLTDLPAKTVAILGYVDPLVAIILSVLLLNEKADAFVIIGAALILGAAICGTCGKSEKGKCE